MAVKGVEIIEGQRWITKDGCEGTILPNFGKTAYVWRLVLDDGKSYTYTENGEYAANQKTNADLSHQVNPEASTKTYVQDVEKQEVSYTLPEIQQACVNLGWFGGTYEALCTSLQELKDPEYMEYLRLKNKFQK